MENLWSGPVFLDQWVRNFHKQDGQINKSLCSTTITSFIGGVPVSVERLAQGLRQLGHIVYVFAPRYGTEQDEAYVIRYRSREKRLEGGEFDLIHVHHPI